MEWLVQAIALALTLLLAVVKSMHFAPSTTSQAELERQSKRGNNHATHELTRRAYVPLLIAAQRLKELILVVGTTTLLVGTFTVWPGLLLASLYIAGAEMAASRGWLQAFAHSLQPLAERHFIALVRPVAWLLKPFAPRTVNGDTLYIASRDELVDLIQTDTAVLTAEEKQRLLGSLHFGYLTVSDAMVPRDNLATVDIVETVGPVLLDRLHKVGHNVFVVIKKDVDHIKGLLYMRDLVPLDPNIATVKDAMRPTVHYIAATAPLAAILGASLQSGRQLFIVVDDQANTLGLITLRDVVAKLLGAAPPAHHSLATDPKKVTPS